MNIRLHGSFPIHWQQQRRRKNLVYHHLPVNIARLLLSCFCWLVCVCSVTTCVTPFKLIYSVLNIMLVLGGFCHYQHLLQRDIDREENLMHINIGYMNRLFYHCHKLQSHCHCSGKKSVNHTWSFFGKSLQVFKLESTLRWSNNKKPGEKFSTPSKLMFCLIRKISSY